VLDGTREARSRGIVVGFHRYGAGKVVDTNDGRVSPPCGSPERAGWSIVRRPRPARALAPTQGLVGDDADPAGPPASAVPSRFSVLVLRWHEVVARAVRLARDKAPAGIVDWRCALWTARQYGEPWPTRQRPRNEERVGRQPQASDDRHGAFCSTAS
jgi:hypothetical protein